MSWFTRSLGGFLGDKFAGVWGLKGRVFLLFLAVFCEGLALMLFSQMTVLVLAIPGLIMFSLCVQMSSGATFSVVPFINKKSLGAVAGIVGAGGNVGAVAAGFLFLGAIPWPTALFILGFLVVVCSFFTFLIRFSPEAESQSAREYRAVGSGSMATVSEESETTDWEPVLT